MSSPWARRIVELAALVLPPSHRDRYRREYAAELAALPADERRAFALGVVTHTPALAHRLRPIGPDGHPVPLLCRLHLHHHYVEALTEDRERFQRCSRCGIDDFLYRSVDVHAMFQPPGGRDR